MNPIPPFLSIFILLCSLNSSAVLKTWDGSVDLWNDGSHWSPAGVPTSNDDARVTAGMAVVLNADGICHSLEVSGTGFAIVNHSDRTLRVETDATVSDAGAELRANLGLLDIAGTAYATNNGNAVIDGGTFQASSIVFGTGTLVWNTGTLKLTDTLFIGPGTSLQARKIVSGQHLVTHHDGITSADIYMQDNAVLTLDGGTITCDGLIKSSSADLIIHGGTFTANGSDFDYGSSTILLEGNTPVKTPHMILDGYYFPTLNYAFLLATSQYSKASLTLRDETRLTGNATVAGGHGSQAQVLLNETAEWDPTILSLGSYGHGTLTVTNNSYVSNCQDLHVGRHTGSTGVLYVTGSTWSSYWKTYIGERGRAVVTVRDGSTATLSDQIQDAVFGEYAGSEARVTVTDPGSSFTLSPDSYSHVFYLGKAGTASLLVSNGAHVTFNDFTIAGNSHGGRGDVVVTGPGSRFHVDSDIWLGYEGIGTLQVLDGATTVFDEAKFGEFPKGVSTVLVDGPGTYFNGGGYYSIGGEFLVARYGQAAVQVLNGATMHSSGYSKIGEYDASSGSVTVSGSGSAWHASGDLLIGTTYNNHATGTLTIASGGRVTVNNGVTIGHSSTLKGNGGTLQGSLHNIYGTITPGSSIGIITIDGTFTQAPGGTITMEIAGKFLNQHDRMIISGACELAGTLDVILDGYTPAGGDIYDLFDWEGGTHGSFTTVNLPTLSTGLYWSTNTLYSAGELKVFPEPSMYLILLVILYAVKQHTV